MGFPPNGKNNMVKIIFFTSINQASTPMKPQNMVGLQEASDVMHSGHVGIAIDSSWLVRSDQITIQVYSTIGVWRVMWSTYFSLLVRVFIMKFTEKGY